MGFNVIQPLISILIYILFFVFHIGKFWEILRLI